MALKFPANQQQHHVECPIHIDWLQPAGGLRARESALVSLYERPYFFCCDEKWSGASPFDRHNRIFAGRLSEFSRSKPDNVSIHFFHKQTLWKVFQNAASEGVDNVKEIGFRCFSIEVQCMTGYPNHWSFHGDNNK